MELHESTEDYLEAILNIRNEQGYVRAVDIATYMGVTKPSVSYATKKLRENGYIVYDANGMILLTEEGYAIASEVWTRHQTLALFFMSLGVKERQAMIDACKVEHDLSEETFKAIKKIVES